MYNVVCVKYGDLYTHEDVNRLYKMAKKNISLPFSFCCFTENPNGLDENIIHIPLDESLDLDSFWWKMELFRPEKYPNNNPVLYLDLDVVIQKNIDYLLNTVENKIVTTYLGHVKVNDAFKYPTWINTSIMIFNPNEVKEIFDKFYDQMDYFILKYRGVCRYLCGEHNDLLSTKIKVIKDFYCAVQRPGLISNEEADKYRIKFKKRNLFYYPDVPIALLNGSNRNNTYNLCIEFFSEYYK